MEIKRFCEICGISEEEYGFEFSYNKDGECGCEGCCESYDEELEEENL